MGKATIISGGAEGLYQVQLDYHTSRLAARIAVLDAQIAGMDAQISASEGEIDNTASELASERSDRAIKKDSIAEHEQEIVDLQKEKADLYEEKETKQGSLTAAQAQKAATEQSIADKDEEINDQIEYIATLEEGPEKEQAEADLADLQYERALLGAALVSVQNEIDALTARLAEIENRLAEIDVEIAAIEKTLEDEREELSEIDEKIAELVKEIGAQRKSLGMLKLRKTSLQKERDYLDDNTPQSQTISAWCADYSVSILGAVGTVEVPGAAGISSDMVLVHPGHDGAGAYNATRDGQVQPVIGATFSGAWYNMAMQPGWQKWMPTYRLATITGINHGADTCDVELSAATSAGGLDINAVSTLAGVPIDYMDCNALVFSIGDQVIVRFVGQSWDHPEVIGFKDHPKECADLALFFMDYHESQWTCRFYYQTTHTVSDFFYISETYLGEPISGSYGEIIFLNSAAGVVVVSVYATNSQEVRRSVVIDGVLTCAVYGGDGHVYVAAEDYADRDTQMLYKIAYDTLEVVASRATGASHPFHYDIINLLWGGDGRLYVSGHRVYDSIYELTWIDTVTLVPSLLGCTLGAVDQGLYFIAWGGDGKLYGTTERYSGVESQHLLKFDVSNVAITVYDTLNLGAIYSDILQKFSILWGRDEKIYAQFITYARPTEDRYILKIDPSLMVVIDHLYFEDTAHGSEFSYLWTDLDGEVYFYDSTGDEKGLYRLDTSTMTLIGGPILVGFESPLVPAQNSPYWVVNGWTMNQNGVITNYN